MLSDTHIQLLLNVFLLISTLNFAHSVLSNINDSDSNEVEISYHGYSRSERSLPICELNVACNIVHKRFWFPIKVERLCRCHNTFPCSQQWSQTPDNYTMMLSNRSQLKFCNNISELQTCTTEEPAIQLQSETAMNPRGRSKKALVQTKAAVKCNCPMGRYWKRLILEADNENSTMVYQCAEAKKCETNEICGYVRADIYSTYYQCSCPAGNLCLFVDQNIYNVTELFYSGAGYQALCTPFPNNLNMITALIDFPKILVAVVNGPAIGIAATKLGLCDVVFASEKATFRTPFTILGLCAEGCSTYTFPRIMGISKAGSMLYFNYQMASKEAYSCGLVSHLFKTDDLPNVLQKLEEASTLPIKSLLANKKLMRKWDHDALHRANELECQQLEERIASEDCAEAVIKFMQTRNKL